MRPADLLFEEVTRILEDRSRLHGSPRPLFENIAKRWSLTFGTEVTPAQVVLCLIDLKLARLKSNLKHHDSVVDIAGYAALLHEINALE